jgi:hypothetical protein
MAPAGLTQDSRWQEDNVNRTLFLLILSLTLLVQGCQSSQPVRRPEVDISPSESCRQLLSQVDKVVVDAETTDTSVFRIKDFPYLRANRFLAEMTETENNAPVIRQWLTRMHQLDLEAREKEILNLDNDQFQRLATQAYHLTDRKTFIEAVCTCSDRLFANGTDTQNIAEKVQDAITIPAEYRTWRRVVGLYPLVALPVAYASANAFDKFRAWHALPPEKLPKIGQPIVYRPALPNNGNRIDPASLYQTTPMDALGLPRISPQDERRLADALAPVIVQDTAASYDRIGEIQWINNRLAIAHNVPTGYYYLSQGQFDGRACLQLNYVFWYSHRAGNNAPWIEWGRLDGLTVRITLDHTGHPVMLDIMNNCGCYHFFVPDRAQIRRVRTTTLGLDPLVPTWLPVKFPERRLQLTVSSGWHQVQHIAVDRRTEETVPYGLRPYRELETLRNENGQHRSIFNADGIAWGSDRIEPILFFSMGIPDVGSMRQRGHHAIKLVGRAHFDSPHLFDGTFDYR